MVKCFTKIFLLRERGDDYKYVNCSPFDPFVVCILCDAI
jgi:hypothetical protein